MTPEKLEELHRLSFTDGVRPWKAEEFANYINSVSILWEATPIGLCFIRIIEDEAELLTIATHPDHRRQGLASAMLTSLLPQIGKRACFLEVDKHNEAAIRLYQSLGFTRIGKRSGYYKLANGSRRDAIVMKRDAEAAPL